MIGLWGYDVTLGLWGFVGVQVLHHCAVADGRDPGEVDIQATNPEEGFDPILGHHTR